MTSTQVIKIIAFLLYAATALLGMWYGVQYSIMVSTIS